MLLDVALMKDVKNGATIYSIFHQTKKKSLFLLVSPVNCANLMAATLTDTNFQANFVSNTSLAPIVDQQNLTHVFTNELALKNSLDVETDVLPDAVVHMMQNRVFIPLSLLTTAALHHIQLNQNVKFRHITFENGSGCTSIDETTFPAEDSLSESDFGKLQNWLALVNLLCGPAIVHGWRSHHGKMVSDCRFSLWVLAWHAHDKLLRVHFMSKPFVIDK